MPAWQDQQHRTGKSKPAWSQIPDIDAVMHIHDRPVVPVNPLGGAKQNPPVFGYTATANFTDIPFPDFSYWGHEHGRIGCALALFLPSPRVCAPPSGGHGQLTNSPSLLLQQGQSRLLAASSWVC